MPAHEHTHTRARTHAHEQTHTRARRQVAYSSRSITQREYDMLSSIGPCTASRPLVLDLGAGTGTLSVMAALRGCQIIAFEPEAENAGRMMRNFMDNKVMRNTTIYKNALTGERDVYTVTGDPNDAGGARLTLQFNAGQQEQVYSVTLDDFFEYDARPVLGVTDRLVAATDVNLIMIDVNGAELPVVYGANTMLQLGRVPYIRLVFRSGPRATHGGCSVEQFLEHMELLGYRFMIDGREVPLQALVAWARAGAPPALGTQEAEPPDLVTDLWLVNRDAWVRGAVPKPYFPYKPTSRDMPR